MLCLSIFMIVIAIVRVAAFLLPGHVTDTVWLFFWQTMEAAVAVIMVALTGFRSLFQSDQAKDSRREQGYSGGNQHGLVTLGSSNNKYDKLDSSGNNSLPQIGRSFQDAQKPQVV
ncbi:MAG: hypothetical protein M1822_010050 [Bathelium mastoideum]|nr:MAG: hypothetical protein M1822_010050 [Bathelium mastoideum]